MHSSVHHDEVNTINRYAWVIFGVMAANNFLVIFHRASPAVVALLIKDEFGVGAAVLGWMSSTYFYAYAAMQPVVGYLVDRWGARKTVTMCALIAFVGSIAFGLAPNIWVASFARALVGLGVGGVYVPGMTVLARWFVPERFATINGLFLAAGSVGGLAAATPLAWISREMGWRPAFLIIAFVSLLLALASWLLIRDHRPDKILLETPSIKRRTRESASEREATPPSIGFRQCVLVSLLLLCISGPAQTFISLWGYPFLVDVREMGNIAAGNMIMFMPLGFVIGTPLMGRLSDWYARQKPFLILAAVGFLGFWFILVFFPMVLAAWAMSAMLFVIGALYGSTVNLCFTVIRLSTPAPVLGRVMGWVNSSAFAGMAIFQVLTGWLMDRVGKIGAGGFPPLAYRNAFTLLLAVTALALILVFALRDSRDKR